MVRGQLCSVTFEHVDGLLMWFQYRLRSQAYESGSLEYGRTDAATNAEGGDVRGGASYGEWRV